MPRWLSISLAIFQLIAVAYCWRVAVKLRRRHQRLDDAIEPPQNIQLRLHDGRQIPVDSELATYRTWIVRVPEGILPHDVADMHVDMLPPHTKLEFDFRAQR